LSLDGTYNNQTSMIRFSTTPLRLEASYMGSGIGIVDLEGATFNWVTRVWAFCGGRQVWNQFWTGFSIVLVFKRLYLIATIQI